MKILILVPYPSEGASNRMRIEQYFPYLDSQDMKYRTRPFISKKFYKIIYHDGLYARKAFHFLICFFKRGFDLIRAVNYDVIIVHREIFPLGPFFLERILKVMGKPIIFDFDDAIFLKNASRPNSFVENLKNPKKAAKIISMSRQVLAGNSYLADYALQFNKNVTVLPTCVDTDKFSPLKKSENRSKRKKEEIIIGWMGSITTGEFLKSFYSVFLELRQKYDNVVFKVVGVAGREENFKGVIFKEWRLEDEVEDLSSFDIGIMPMPDNAWTKGKCGFKAILYMAMGIPPVCSPVGVNTETIKDGVNGFLADSQQEWIDKLSRLIESAELREKIGRNGRLTVEEKYSIKANAAKFIDAIEKVYHRNYHGHRREYVS